MSINMYCLAAVPHVEWILEQMPWLNRQVSFDSVISKSGTCVISLKVCPTRRACWFVATSSRLKMPMWLRWWDGPERSRSPWPTWVNCACGTSRATSSTDERTMHIITDARREAAQVILQLLLPLLSLSERFCALLCTTGSVVYNSCALWYAHTCKQFLNFCVGLGLRFVFVFFLFSLGFSSCVFMVRLGKSVFMFLDLVIFDFFLGTR